MVTIITYVYTYFSCLIHPEIKNETNYHIHVWKCPGRLNWDFDTSTNEYGNINLMTPKILSLHSNRLPLKHQTVFIELVLA